MIVWVVLAAFVPVVLGLGAAVFRYGGLAQAVRDLQEDFDYRLRRIEAILDRRTNDPRK
jgi:hypothetical protein